jgi:aspartate/methionine/tyrosine aminotransferase
MAFVPFELERWQSVWENKVRFNLAESGVHPLSVEELLEITDTDPEILGAQRLLYSQSNGTEALRAAISALYPGTTEDNILVTVGSSGANFVICWTTLEPGQRATIQVPNYLQTWGVARSNGADVNTFPLRPELGWEPDLDEMRAAIRPDTKLVVITNPNNPTGRVLSAEARDAILARAADVGAWLLADEVYQGAERDGALTESCWGKYDRAVITGGLSKAYGLPGLRIGWVVGPPAFIKEAWSRQDYTVIGPSAVSDLLATRALGARDRILERTRGILRENYATLEGWLQSLGDLLTWRPPDAGAICLVEYRLGIESMALVEHLRETQDILMVPGAHVGLENYLRIGFGEEPGYLAGGLDALGAGLRGLVRD